MRTKDLHSIMFCGRPGTLLLPGHGAASSELLDHVRSLQRCTFDAHAGAAPTAEAGARIFSHEYAGSAPFGLVLTRNMRLSSQGAGQAFFVSADGRRQVFPCRLWMSDDSLFDGTVFHGDMVPLVDAGQTGRPTPWVFLVSDMPLVRGRRAPVLLRERIDLAAALLCACHVADDHDACLLRVADPRAADLDAAYPPVTAWRVRDSYGAEEERRPVAARRDERAVWTQHVVAPLLPRPGTLAHTPVHSPGHVIDTHPIRRAVQTQSRRELTLWASPTGLPDVYELSEVPLQATASHTVGVVHAYIPTLRVSAQMAAATARGPAQMRFFMHPTFGKWTPVEQERAPPDA